MGSASRRSRERALEDGEDRGQELLRPGEDDLGEVEGGDDRGQGHAEALPPASTTSWPSGVSRAARSRGIDSQVSRQPRLPHGQSSPPSVPTVTWPISPAAWWAPDTRRPPVMMRSRRRARRARAPCPRCRVRRSARPASRHPSRWTRERGDRSPRRPARGAARRSSPGWVPCARCRRGRRARGCRYRCRARGTGSGPGWRARARRPRRGQPHGPGRRRRRRRAPRAPPFAGDVEYGGLQPGRNGQVDGEGEQAAAVEVDERGALARPALLRGADVEHPALVDELGDEVRHGHLRDPHLPGWARLVGPRRRNVWSTSERFWRRPSVGRTAAEGRTRRGMSRVTRVSKLY